MLEQIRNFPNELRRAIARRKARRTAIKNGHELLKAMLPGTGYTFIPARNGFFFVYGPDSATPSYDLQVYYDPVLGAWSYLCGCPSCSNFGVCKHGVALVLYIEKNAPLMICAHDAPKPDDQPKRTHSAASAAFSPGEGVAVRNRVFHPVRLLDPQFAGYLNISTETTNYGGYGS